jgi:hypothetical protein
LKQKSSFGASTAVTGIMEALLDAADELAKEDRPDRPDFAIPDDYSHLVDPTKSTLLDLRDSPIRGKGWFAAQDLSPGTVVLVAKPIAMIMDWEGEDEESINVSVITENKEPDREQNQDAMEDDEDEADTVEKDEYPLNDDEPETRLNELLLLDILEALEHDRDLWFQHLSQLFPRTDAELCTLPAWVCPDDAIFMQVEASFEQLRASGFYTDEDVKDISKRLPRIIRYNVLSVETCSELLSFPGPGGHVSLSGVALYHYPSLFNHSARPNCCRWAVGDVMFFVTNQAVSTGQEVCISYIEHDVLCESPYRRNSMMRMDFQDSIEGTEPDHRQGEKAGPELPVVDTDVQNELMAMDPFERLSSLEELLMQAQGEKIPEGEQPHDGEGGMEISPASGWFQCDVHNLRILKAITLDGLGQYKEALEVWEKAVAFCEQKLPLADESSVAVRSQAALCALYAGEKDRSQQHALIALQTHNLLFGGGLAFFRRRFHRDLELSLRPVTSSSDTASPVDVLWPLTIELKPMCMA